MPGRNEAEAWRNCAGPIERAVDCVDLNVRLNRRPLGEGLYFLGTAAERPVVLTAALRLRFSFHFRPIETDTGWHMTTRRYDFNITPASDPDCRLLGWHWHPESKQSAVKYPHIHVQKGAAFRTRHIPSGRISLEDVLAFALDELGAKPASANGRDVLQGVLETHKQHRRW